MRLVLIEWEDSFGRSSDWRSVDVDPPEKMICRSVGWLLHDGKDCKTIVPHLSAPDHKNTEHQQGCGDMTIPTRSIIRIVDLQAPEERELDDSEWSYDDAFKFVKANSGYSMRPLARSAWMVANDEGRRIDRKGNLI